MLSPFEWCVATSFYQRSANHVSFYLLFNLRNLFYLILLAPIGNPAPRGFSPLDAPIFLTAKGYPNHKNRFGAYAVKNRKSEKSPRGGLEKFRIFVHGSLLRICKFPWSRYGRNEGMVDEFENFLSGRCFCFDNCQLCPSCKIFVCVKTESSEFIRERLRNRLFQQII